MNITNMNIITVIFIVLTLGACSAIKIGNGRAVITVEKEKPFCDINKVDSKCKVEGKYH